MLNLVLVFLFLLSTFQPTVETDWRLMELTRARADDLAQGAPFKHNNYITSRIWNYQWEYERCICYGELLGRTTTGTVDDIFRAFMDSPPHRSLLTSSWDKVGVGIAKNNSYSVIIVVSLVRSCQNCKIK